jgi:hypothetical protein
MKRKRVFVLDGTGTHPPPAPIDLLKHGSQGEIRETLHLIGSLMRLGTWTAPAEELEWLGAALEAIGRGEKPHIALGLNTKREDYRAILARKAAADDLFAQGRTREDAMQIAGRLNYESGELRPDPKGAAGESLKAAAKRRRMTK